MVVNLQESVPIGHSITAHATLGWCAVCAGRDLLDELIEWRALALAQLAPYCTDQHAPPRAALTCGQLLLISVIGRVPRSMTKL